MIRRVGSALGRLAALTYRQARRIVVLVVGGTVLLIGVVMVVTPGPAVVVIPLGLSILALEFAFARRWLEAVKARAVAAGRAVRGAEGEEEAGS